MKQLLLFGAILGFLFGCNVDKRNIERMQVYAVRYPNQFKTLANTLVPCFNGKAKSDTVITTRFDTVTNTVDRIVPGAPGKPDTIYKSGKTIVKTITHKITDTIVNDRAIAALQSTNKITSDSLTITKTKLDTATKKANKFEKWFWLIVIIEGAAMLVFVGIKIYTLATGGAIAAMLKKV